MFFPNRNKFWILVGLVLLTFSIVKSTPRRTSRLSAGTWGGVHIKVEVVDGVATIEYDCANGSIDGPLEIDTRGRFNWRGTHTRQGPGPIRLGRSPKSLPTVFSGSVKGDTMTLTVKLADTKEVLGTYTLKRGSEGRIRRCY